MARTEVPTYVTNQLLTAAHGNTYWRDNLNELWPFTDAGDLAYAAGATTLAKLAIGAAGRRLGVASGLPAWSYGAPLLTYGLDQMTSPWQSTTAQAFQDSPLNMTLTLPVAGVIMAFAHFMAKSSSSSYAAIFRLNIDDEGGVTHTNTASSGYTGSNCSHMKACAAGDIVVKLEGYGYLTASMYADDGELIALAFPAA